MSSKESRAATRDGDDFSEESKGQFCKETFVGPTKAAVINAPKQSAPPGYGYDSKDCRQKSYGELPKITNESTVITLKPIEKKKPKFQAGVLNAPNVCQPGYKPDSSGKPRKIF